jgi:hypothetical protein
VSSVTEFGGVLVATSGSKDDPAFDGKRWQSLPSSLSSCNLTSSYVGALKDNLRHKRQSQQENVDKPAEGRALPGWAGQSLDERHDVRQVSVFVQALFGGATHVVRLIVTCDLLSSWFAVSYIILPLAAGSDAVASGERRTLEK